MRMSIEFDFIMNRSFSHSSMINKLPSIWMRFVEPEYRQLGSWLLYISLMIVEMRIDAFPSFYYYLKQVKNTNLDSSLVISS